MEELQDLASPIGAFVRECCDIGPQFVCQSDAMLGVPRMEIVVRGRTHRVTTRATKYRSAGSCGP